MKLHKWRDIKRESLLNRKAIAASLTKLRKGLGMTKKALTAAVGHIELGTVDHRWEQRLSVLRTIVEALGGELEVVAVVGGKRVRLHV